MTKFLDINSGDGTFIRKADKSYPALIQNIHMASDVEKIKERLTIEEVVGSYVELKQSGKYLKAKSPFTNENTPSFYVSPDKGLFHCFSSNKGGDIFTFVEEMEGVEFREALKILADRAGITLSNTGGDSGETKRLRDIMAAARDFYVQQLQSSQTALAYLKERGITEATAKKFSLGQAPDEWRAVLVHLEKQGYKTENIIAAGLAKQPNNDKPPYDRFRNRLLFPLNDPAGRPVAFSGRRLDDDDPAKYINSPETPLFRKKQLLYGFDMAKNSLRDLKAAILVEGQIDLVLAHQAGFTNTVASSGTAITSHHLKLIQRFTDKIILALDTDTAGRASTLKTARLALSTGMKPKVVSLPADTDPADIINQQGVKAFKEVVAGARDVIDVVLDWIQEESGSRAEFLDSLQQQIFPLLSSIKNEINQDHLISRVAQQADIREETLRSELTKAAGDDRSSTNEPKPKTRSGLSAVARSQLLTPQERKHEIHKQLLAVCAWQNQQSEPVIDSKKTEEKIAEILTYDLDPASDVEVSDNDVMALEITYEDTEDRYLRRDVAELLLHFEERILQHTYERASRAVSRETDKKKRQQLLEKCQKISRRIHTLREEIRELV